VILRAAAVGAGEHIMGAPIVHFEIIANDSKALSAYYAELFGWHVDPDNEFNYGVVAREDNLNPQGIGIGGGIGPAMGGGGGHVTVYAEVPDVEASLAKAEALGGRRLFGPDKVMAGMTLGQFSDPEGHIIGLIETVAS
jgi:predicted enzyme related to lactoylglutathione lyase